MEKRGLSHHWIIISAIIAIIILGISFIFISEPLARGRMDWEVCRKSIIARNSVPNWLLIENAKELLPLECGIHVVKIDYEDVERAEAEIADVLAECKGLYEGQEGYKFSLYPPSLLGDGYCSPCARIEFAEDVKDFYEWEKPDELGKDDFHLIGYMERTNFLDSESIKDYVWDELEPSETLDRLKLPRDVHGDFGLRSYIDPNHDLIIGNYFYAGAIVEKILPGKNFLSLTFYYQPGIDRTDTYDAECKWEGVLG